MVVILKVSGDEEEPSNSQIHFAFVFLSIHSKCHMGRIFIHMPMHGVFLYCSNQGL